MVAAARRGVSLRSVARQFEVSLYTVQRWVARAQGQRLDRADWADRPAGPRRPANRVPESIEELTVAVRRELREHSILGEFGDRAILQALMERQASPVPSLRTIGRILERRGVLDGRRRLRYPSPPRGWYLPDVAQGKAELDSFDIIEGLVIQGGPEVEVLNGISLHGGWVTSWPAVCMTAKTAVEALLARWAEFGLPCYAQFDNDTRFQGAHQFQDAFGRVTRLCLSLGVTPVFVPPREMGFQAAIENFNGRWQAKVWTRFHHDCLGALRARSAAYICASHQRSAARIDSAPARRPFPGGWGLNWDAPLGGSLIYLRRTNEAGVVELLGHRFEVCPSWPHRLVRCVVDLEARRIRFYALRRRNPADQPLLIEVPYNWHPKPFQGDP